VLAQAALYVVLSEQSALPVGSMPWETLAARRFGGDVHERTVTFRQESTDAGTEAEDLHVRVVTKRPGTFNVHVGDTAYIDVSASISATNKLSCSLDGRTLRNTVVLQRAPAGLPASSANAQDRVHVFHAGARTSLVLPAPAWLQKLGAGALHARGALRAPKPSLVVEVRVAPGERVEKGQAVVVLESMKTETVLRAGAAGVVKAVGCAKGEMAEEGRELVDIEHDPTDE
jgi:3-methylcrotonyl-CoA carboxylase alpha subunit